MHGVYKYEVDSKVIYIGKTSSSFFDRINCHACEEKFKPYLDKAVIYTCFTEDEGEADFLETALIAEYKPILNVAKKRVTAAHVHVDMEWDSYSPKRKCNLHDRGYTGKKTHRLQILTYESLTKRMDAYAKDHDMSRAELFELAVNEFLERNT